MPLGKATRSIQVLAEEDRNQDRMVKEINDDKSPSGDSKCW
jgi:hypothetical protein